MHLFRIDLRKILILLSLLLSSVTAFTTWFTFSSLLEGLHGRFLAASAVIFDLYKYLAWPLAMALIAKSKKEMAGVVIISALLIHPITAWSTYSVFKNGVTASETRVLSFNQQIAELTKTQEEAKARIISLNDDEKSVHEQASKLREAKIAAKALEFEQNQLTYINQQRQEAQQRAETATVQLTALLATPPTSTGIPTALANLLCIGFAFLLEIVPTIINCAIRPEKLAVTQIAEQENASTEPQKKPTTVTTTPVAAVITPVFQGETVQHTVFSKRSDEELFQRLRDITKTTQPGTPISIRDITTTFNVGNRRAGRLVETAISLGLMRKTAAGYVAA